MRISLTLVALAFNFTLAAAAFTATPAEQLTALLDDEWQFRLREDPLFATSAGVNTYNDKLPRVRVQDFERLAGEYQKFLARLRAIDRAALTPAERINRDLFEKIVGDMVQGFAYQAHLLPITNREGFHISFAELPKNVPLKTLKDYENYVARLSAFEQYAGDHIELMREGIKQGMVLPDIVLRGAEVPIQSQIVDEPTKSLLFAPFLDGKFPDAVSEEDRNRLADAAKTAIADSVVPGYRAFLKFMQEEYIPAARAEIGAASLPMGRDYYRFLVRKFTTLDLSPDEVHEIGQREVARIREEMEQVVKRAKFGGDRQAFVEFLRNDNQFYAKTPDELMKLTAQVMKKIDGQLPALFKTLPRMPYGLREVPEYIAPLTTTAYYQPPAGDGTRAGFYYVNVYDLKSRPLYDVEALSLHEAVPGHHLQIALQQEMQGLPDFRRFSDITAFVEGWALYAERLGLETGFYQDPYSDYGRLSYEMWRACRLVVDTGMHYQGWSRQQAIDFMVDNTALSLHNITAEVDRYISWPGQALAYKIGELKIRELRKEAEDALGDRFDIREFHDVVLGSGAVTLGVLEGNVREWIEGQK